MSMTLRQRRFERLSIVKVNLQCCCTNIWCRIFKKPGKLSLPRLRSYASRERERIHGALRLFPQDLRYLIFVSAYLSSFSVPSVISIINVYNYFPCTEIDFAKSVRSRCVSTRMLMRSAGCGALLIRLAPAVMEYAGAAGLLAKWRLIVLSRHRRYFPKRTAKAAVL